MNRSLKLSLFCLGIFACGVVVGGVGARRLQPPALPQPGPATENFGPNMMRKLTHELELTDTQRAAINPAIQKASDELRELRKESFRKSTLVMEALETAVASHLNPLQLEKYTELKKLQKQRIKAIMEERQRRRSESIERERNRDERERPRESKRPTGEREPKPEADAPPPPPPQKT